jgi:hypothetical protein
VEIKSMGLEHVIQALYDLSYTTSPFVGILFLKQGLTNFA